MSDASAAPENWRDGRRGVNEAIENERIIGRMDIASDGMEDDVLISDRKTTEVTVPVKE